MVSTLFVDICNYIATTSDEYPAKKAFSTLYGKKEREKCLSPLNISIFLFYIYIYSGFYIYRICLKNSSNSQNGKIYSNTQQAKINSTVKHQDSIIYEGEKYKKKSLKYISD
jgi:hypothetical protein